MEYYSDKASRTSYPRHCIYGYDGLGVLADCTCMENDVALAADGESVYGVCDVTSSDNGDVIATVSDTNTDHDHAPYSFLKYALTTLSLTDFFVISRMNE